jgi:opacity protein-like surface antigen
MERKSIAPVPASGRLCSLLLRALIALPLLCALAAATLASAQVAESAVGGNQMVSAGVLGSAFQNNYGQRRLAGFSAFIDVDLNRHYGIEGEGSWLRWHQRDKVYIDTYLAGPRYQFNYIGRFRPYAKFLIGDGKFNFPYNYGYGNYFVMAPGAGIDFRLTPRIDWRVADFEYQVWPGFTFGTLHNYGISSGIRVRLF